MIRRIKRNPGPQIRIGSQASASQDVVRRRPDAVLAIAKTINSDGTVDVRVPGDNSDRRRVPVVGGLAGNIQVGQTVVVGFIERDPHRRFILSVSQTNAYAPPDAAPPGPSFSEFWPRYGATLGFHHRVDCESLNFSTPAVVYVSDETITVLRRTQQYLWIGTTGHLRALNVDDFSVELDLPVVGVIDFDAIINSDGSAEIWIASSSSAIYRVTADGALWTASISKCGLIVFDPTDENFLLVASYGSGPTVHRVGVDTGDIDDVYSVSMSATFFPEEFSLSCKIQIEEPPFFANVCNLPDGSVLSSSGRFQFDEPTRYCSSNSQVITPGPTVYDGLGYDSDSKIFYTRGKALQELVAFDSDGKSVAWTVNDNNFTESGGTYTLWTPICVNSAGYLVSFWETHTVAAGACPIDAYSTQPIQYPFFSDYPPNPSMFWQHRIDKWDPFYNWYDLCEDKDWSHDYAAETQSTIDDLDTYVTTLTPMEPVPFWYTTQSAFGWETRSLTTGAVVKKYQLEQDDARLVKVPYDLTLEIASETYSRPGGYTDPAFENCLVGDIITEPTEDQLFRSVKLFLVDSGYDNSPGGEMCSGYVAGLDTYPISDGNPDWRNVDLGNLKNPTLYFEHEPLITDRKMIGVTLLMEVEEVSCQTTPLPAHSLANCAYDPETNLLIFSPANRGNTKNEVDWDSSGSENGVYPDEIYPRSIGPYNTGGEPRGSWPLTVVARDADTFEIAWECQIGNVLEDE